MAKPCVRWSNAYWLHRLDHFQPEMIFISAGFDGHKEDDLGGMGLVEADYAWLTAKLMEIANRYAKGRVVSCLEGITSTPWLAACGGHVRTLIEG